MSGEDGIFSVRPYAVSSRNFLKRRWRKPSERRKESEPTGV